MGHGFLYHGLICHPSILPSPFGEVWGWRWLAFWALTLPNLEVWGGPLPPPLIRNCWAKGHLCEGVVECVVCLFLCSGRFGREGSGMF